MIKTAGRKYPAIQETDDHVSCDSGVGSLF